VTLTNQNFVTFLWTFLTTLHFQPPPTTTTTDASRASVVVKGKFFLINLLSPYWRVPCRHRRCGSDCHVALLTHLHTPPPLTTHAPSHDEPAPSDQHHNHQPLPDHTTTITGHQKRAQTTRLQRVVWALGMFFFILFSFHCSNPRRSTHVTAPTDRKKKPKQRVYTRRLGF
jgi:hypothetical protein